MGNTPSVQELQKKKSRLENTIVEYEIVIRKERVYGDRTRIQSLQKDIEELKAELAKLNKTLSKT